MALKETKNYTLGRGRLFFSRFIEGTQTPEGFLYFGNTPEFNLTIESDDLDHFSSDEGIREKDDGVTLEVTRSGSLITDNIAPDNVALFFFGEIQTIAQSASGTATWTLENAKNGYEYLVGATDANPTGVKGIDAATFVVAEGGGVAATGSITLSGVPVADDTVVVNGQTYKFVTALGAANDVLIGSNAQASAANLNAAINGGSGSGIGYAAGTVANGYVTSKLTSNQLALTSKAKGVAGNAYTLTKTGAAVTVSGATMTGGSASGAVFVLDTDYKINLDTGRLTILGTGSIPDATDLDITYQARAATRDRVLSGTKAVEGALMYEANNPKGKNFDYYMGYVQISPNGDYALKGDEWQQIPFNLQILKPRSGVAAILMDGRPVYA
jgi:hypothetical protein